MPPITTVNIIQGQVNLVISRDNGRTYLPSHASYLGKNGQVTNRSVWGPTGQVRKDKLVLEVNATLRMFEARCTATPKAHLDAVPAETVLDLMVQKVGWEGQYWGALSG